MHLNMVQLIGRVGAKLPRLDYASSGHPTCSFTLEVDEVAKSGETFVLYLPCEIWGSAEHAAELLEPGDEIMLSGRLKYKSQVDPKTQVKTSKLIISSWGIQQRQPAETSPETVDDSASVEAALNVGHAGEPDTHETRETAPKAKRPRRLTQGPKWTGQKSALN